MLARFYKEFSILKEACVDGSKPRPSTHQKQQRNMNIGMGIHAEALGPTKSRATKDPNGPRKANCLEMASCITLLDFSEVDFCNGNHATTFPPLQGLNWLLVWGLWSMVPNQFKTLTSEFCQGILLNVQGDEKRSQKGEEKGGNLRSFFLWGFVFEWLWP